MSILTALLILGGAVALIVSPGAHLGSTLVLVAFGLFGAWQAAHWLLERRGAKRAISGSELFAEMDSPDKLGERRN
jgi:hypothetical protein